MRIRAIDWLRGLVVLLMTVDHAGGVLDAAHLHGDNGARWVPGSPLPSDEFLTRWITHLCAPTFVLLAGASIALSTDKRRDDPSQTRFLVTRGLLIAALDPLWMSLGFASYKRVILQVLYAIGLSMVAMAWLRRLSSRALFTMGLAIVALGELSDHVRPESPIAHGGWALLFAGGPVGGPVFCAYPLVPWLALMMLGVALGRWLLATPAQDERVRFSARAGLAALALFVVVRAADGYGNWNLHRDSLAPLQWLHVAKYPPSLAYVALELGLALLFFAAFLSVDRATRPRGPILASLELFGSVAFFYYLLHVHVLAAVEAIFALDTHQNGLAKTWAGAALTAALLAWPCVLYRRKKKAKPNGWMRYV